MTCPSPKLGSLGVVFYLITLALVIIIVVVFVVILVINEKPSRLV